MSNSRFGSDEREQSSNSGRQLQMLRFDDWTTVTAMNSIIYSNCEFRSHSDVMDSRQEKCCNYRCVRTAREELTRSWARIIIIPREGPLALRSTASIPLLTYRASDSKRTNPTPILRVSTWLPYIYCLMSWDFDSEFVILKIHCTFRVGLFINMESYRVIKKSLCTWRLHYNYQVHRDFWSPCMMKGCANSISFWLCLFMNGII